MSFEEVSEFERLRRLVSISPEFKALTLFATRFVQVGEEETCEEGWKGSLGQDLDLRISFSTVKNR